jgi:hypothetical protein
MYVRVCVCVCVCVCLSVCLSVYIYVYIYTHIYIMLNTRPHNHTHVHTNVACIAHGVVGRRLPFSIHTYLLTCTHDTRSSWCSRLPSSMSLPSSTSLSTVWYLRQVRYFIHVCMNQCMYVCFINGLVFMAGKVNCRHYCRYAVCAFAGTLFAGQHRPPQNPCILSTHVYNLLCVSVSVVVAVT